MMLRPFLFIGVGGSGGKTLWTLRDELRNRLDEVGYPGDIPAAWQFLHIDVPTLADGADADLGAQLPASNYVGLVADGIVYKTIDHALITGAEHNANVRNALAGWRPDPNRVAVPVEKGAGQYRTLGRVITVTNLKKVNEAIRTAVDKLQGAGIATELAQVSKRFGAEEGAKVPSPVAVVVSSMAGGSGAGAVLDVCDVLRATGEIWADRSFGFLFAPDVFNALAPSQRKGVQANALATLSEVMAGFWNWRGPNTGGFEEEFALFERAQIVPGSFQRRGPRYPIIVGNSNGEVTFTLQNEVYRAAGKALAAWTVSPKIQDFLGAYFEANYASSASLTDHLPLHENGREMPFSAVGFGRVSLGRDRFARYSTERLARGAVERLLRRHEEGRTPGQEFDSQAAIEELVVARVRAFIVASGLDERGKDRNAVLDALRPPDRRSRMDAIVSTVVGEISVGNEKGAAPKKWTTLAVARAQQLAGSFADEERAKRLDEARVWAYSLSEKLTDLVAKTAARDGLHVTVALLDRLDSELQFVLGELPLERANLLGYASKLEEFVAEEIGKAGDTKIMPANPQIRAGVQRAVECMEWRAEADLISLATELITDIKANLIQPLRNALRTGTDVLAVAESQRPGAPASIVASWPDHRVVPSRFTPSQNERLLLAPTSYTDEFDRKIIDSTKAADPDGAFTEAVMDLITGNITEIDGAQQMISVRQQWHPSHPDVVRDVAGSGSKARFELRTKPEELLDRSRAWVNRTDTALGSYVSESLKSYLSPDVEPAELDRRLTAFRGEFMSAVDAAKPLVDISPQVLARTHDQDKPSWKMLFTEMPFPPGTKAREIAEEVLEARHQLTEDVKTAFGEGNAERVDIFTVLESPYEPVVFNSIMKPIADEWAARSQSADQREEFWRWRRARPLASFIPTTPDVRESMVRGWFIARSLDQVTVDKTTRIVKIYSPEKRAMLSFPTPLIGPAVFHDYDYLPAVLESLPLAMLDFASRADGELAMLPYARLRKLGENGEDNVSDFSSLNTTVSRWVQEGVIVDHRGTIQESAPVPAPTNAGSRSDSPSERGNALIQYMKAREKSYLELFAKDVDMLKFFSVPRVWELRTDVTNAFRYIIEALETAVMSEGDF